MVVNRDGVQEEGEGKVSSSKSAQADLQSSLASAMGQLSNSKGENGKLKGAIDSMKGQGQVFMTFDYVVINV